MTKEEVIKNAQYRKNLSIAFFNATNAAIELVKCEFDKHEDITDLKKSITEYRDWLLEEHKNYYAENIANIGVNYDAANTIKKLEDTKTVDELKNVWISLSEDERQDEQIKAKAQLLKKQLA